MTAPTNIASHLSAMATLQPHKLAIAFPEGRNRAGRVLYSHLTYRQLDDDSTLLARGLERSGIGRGVRAVLMVKPSLELFSLTFALFKAGAIPVMVDPGIGRKSLGTCLGEAEPTAFIGIPKAHVARALFGWARKSLKIRVTVGRRGFWGGLDLEDLRRAGREAGDAPMAPTRPDETAAILFTSGSTGIPKGAVYTHGTFIAQVEMIRRTYGIEPGEVDLPTFPLFGLFDPALGMSTIIPDMDASKPAKCDPALLVEAIEDFGVTNMFGSPAVINRLARWGTAHGVKLPTLRRVLSAGAPVSPDILEQFSTMLNPGVEIFTPYGATESLPVASIGSREILSLREKTRGGAGICVGRPVEGVDVEIIEITDGPLPMREDSKVLKTGEIGEIVARSPTVTRAYFQRPAATALAKIAGPGDVVGHRMGDLGYFDDTGRLWYCGRKSHRVVLKDRTLFTDPCENVFNAHPHVFRTALVGVRRGDETRPVLCIELEAASKGVDREQVKRELLALGAAVPQTAPITELLFHDAFPVDIRHNAKIFREQLATWATKELA